MSMLPQSDVKDGLFDTLSERSLNPAFHKPNRFFYTFVIFAKNMKYFSFVLKSINPERDLLRALSFLSIFLKRGPFEGPCPWMLGEG